MITRKMVFDICQKYRIVVNSVSNVMDTSHGEKDFRYNYIINNSYVLKMNNSPTITEERVGNIQSLVNRYLSIGVWSPTLIKNIDDNFVYQVDINQHVFNCYIEEYSLYLLAQDFFTGEKYML